MKCKQLLKIRWVCVRINKRIAAAHFEDDYSFERFMDARYPYLSTVEYKKRKPLRSDTDYLKIIDDFLT